MLAVVFDETIRVMDVGAPVPAAGEALVRVVLAGICGTDVELLRGYKGFRGIPGHEMVGIVESAPDPTWVGARVVSEINLSCGECRLCREGLGKHCERRQVLGILGRPGVFAEKVAIPLKNLHRVPESITDEEAVWTEPLAAGLAVIEAGMGPGDSVLVLGDGRLGACVALGLGQSGVRVEVAGKDPVKLEILRSLGVAIQSGRPSPLYRFVVEATGNPSGLEDARAWTRPRGTIVLKSTCHQRSEVDLAAFVVDEIRVLGSRCGDFPPAIGALISGRVPVGRLVSGIYPLNEFREALSEATRPGVFKVLLDMRSGHPHSRQPGA